MSTCARPECGAEFESKKNRGLPQRYCSRACRLLEYRERKKGKRDPSPKAEGQRQCAGCKDVQPANDFYRSNTRKDGRSPYCKKCDRLRKKESREKNPPPLEVRREYHRRYRARNPDRARAQDRAQTIRSKGISVEAYEALFETQKGACAICEKSQTGRRLAIDHDHATGRVRGLLCNTCNTALGKFRDSPALLKKASKYILSHSCRLVAMSGKKGSGKDTAAELLVSEGFERVSFAGPLKEAVRTIFGWSEQHTDGDLKEEVDPEWGLSPRHAMQRIGTDLVRGYMQDLWVKGMKRRLQAAWREDPTKKFVVADCRFENEADLIKSLGGQVWRIVRPGIVSEDTHPSETGLDTYGGFDEIILNDSDVPGLHEKARVCLQRTLEGTR